MSLPPVQPLVPETVKKPIKPEAPGKAKDEGFDDELQSANTRQEKQVNTTEDQGEESTNRQTDAAVTGNEVPDGEVSSETPILVTEVESNAIAFEILNLGGTPSPSDQAVLLASNFVVDTLQRNTGELEVSLPQVKSDVLARIAPTSTSMGMPVGVMAGDSNVMPGLLKLDVSAMKELVKSVDKIGAADVTPAQSTNSSAVELKPIPLPTKTELTVPTRVGASDWGEAMAGRINLMVNQKISAARIHINPPELGPIEVRVNLNHDQASVQFTSPSAQVRDALEQSIPRLRDMLETAGFSLADSDVSDHGQQQSKDGNNDFAGQDEEQLVHSEVPESIGLVDERV